MFLVGALGGLLVGYISAQTVRGRPIVSGIIGNLAATVTFFLCTIAFTGVQAAQITRNLRDLALAVGVMAAVFIVPGIFGSIWVWEGNKNRDLGMLKHPEKLEHRE